MTYVVLNLDECKALVESAFADGALASARCMANGADWPEYYKAPEAECWLHKLGVIQRMNARHHTVAAMMNATPRSGHAPN